MEKVSSKVLNSFSLGLLLISIGLVFFFPGIMSSGGDEDSFWIKVTPVLVLLGSAIIAAMAFNRQEGENPDVRSGMNLIALGAVIIAVFAILIFKMDLKENEKSMYLEFSVLLAGFIVLALGFRNLADNSELNGLEHIATAAWVAAIAAAAVIVLMYFIESATKQAEALYDSSTLSYEQIRSKAKSLAEEITRNTGLWFAALGIITLATAAAACGLRVLAGSSDNYTESPETPAE